MPKFKKNPSPMKKQAYGIAKSPFAMKYKNSAFPFAMRSGNTTPFKMMGSSPAKLKGFFVTDEFGESTQVSKTDYYKADKDKRYSTGRAKMTEMSDKYEAMKSRAVNRGADKRELADLKEAHISAVFEDFQEALEYSQTEKGKAEYEKQKELGI